MSWPRALLASSRRLFYRQRVRTVPISLAATTLLACSVQVTPRQASADDPSNPRAPTSAYEALPNTVASDVLAEPEKPPPSDTVYACPMGHVVRDAPGDCPVCGMPLVPKPRAK